MSYLFAQILVCLFIAGLIGGIVGWFLRGGCKNKLRENDEYWEGLMNSTTSGWETKVQGLMLDKEKYTKNSEDKLLGKEQKVLFFEKQNRELTLKNSNLLLNEQQLMNKSEEELVAQNLTWEGKVKTLLTSKESIKSEALNLTTHYKDLKLKFLEKRKKLEEKSQLHEKLESDFAWFQKKSEKEKNELDNNWNIKFTALQKEQLDKDYSQVRELKNKIAFLETQNIELDKKFTMEKLAFKEKEESLLSQINSLKDEKKD